MASWRKWCQCRGISLSWCTSVWRGGSQTQELVGQVEGTTPILRAANLAQLLSASAIRLAAGER